MLFLNAIASQETVDQGDVLPGAYLMESLCHASTI